jgi:hypothetical protein
MSQHLQSPHAPSTAKTADEERSHDTPVDAFRYAGTPAERLEVVDAFLAAAERRLAFPSALSESERLVLRGVLALAATHLDIAGEGDFSETCPERFDATSERIGRALDQLDA